MSLRDNGATKIGGATGASPFHLQRAFKARAGLTPREYADEGWLSVVRKQLGSGRKMTEAVYEAGYGSSSRLHERSAPHRGMTPGAYARGGASELLNYAHVRSPLGLLLLAATARACSRLDFRARCLEEHSHPLRTPGQAAAPTRLPSAEAAVKSFVPKQVLMAKRWPGFCV